MRVLKKYDIETDEWTVVNQNKRNEDMKENQMDAALNMVVTEFESTEV